MGQSYVIDPARELVEIRLSGRVSIADLQEVQRLVPTDPAFVPGFATLTDLSGVTEVDVDSFAIAAAASAPLFRLGARRAIVAPTDFLFGMARMYASYAERSGGQIHVFRDREAAEAWLRS
jgi:hypothetical protein